METLGNKLGAKRAKKGNKGQTEYYCEKCDFGCFGEILLNRHLETKKHLNL